MVPVVLQFAFDWREGEPLPREEWAGTALFVLGWPLASAWAIMQLVRGRPL